MKFTFFNVIIIKRCNFFTHPLQVITNFYIYDVPLFSVKSAFLNKFMASSLFIYNKLIAFCIKP